MGSKLTQERLKELLHYDEGTGLFVWRVKKGRSDPGDYAGTPHNAGYVTIKIDGVKYLRHRCAWLYTYGAWPVDSLDHRNGVRGDDRLENLRECTTGQNHQNKARKEGSSSGLLGVTWDKRSRKWKAQIKAGRPINLGEFSDKFQAHQAYLAAKAQFHTFNPTPRPQ